MYDGMEDECSKATNILKSLTQIVIFEAGLGWTLGTNKTIWLAKLDAMFLGRIFASIWTKTVLPLLTANKIYSVTGERAAPFWTQSEPVLEYVAEQELQTSKSVQVAHLTLHFLHPVEDK